jgi:hypothetical protein
MRVVVSSSGEPLNRQILSYAEYRIFSALSTHDDVLDARVSLCAAHGEVQCSVHVNLTARDPIEARTTGPHAAAAIDGAADRLASLLSLAA